MRSISSSIYGNLYSRFSTTRFIDGAEVGILSGDPSVPGRPFTIRLRTSIRPRCVASRCANHAVDRVGADKIPRIYRRAGARLGEWIAHEPLRIEGQYTSIDRRRVRSASIEEQLVDFVAFLILRLSPIVFSRTAGASCEPIARRYSGRRENAVPSDVVECANSFRRSSCSVPNKPYDHFSSDSYF